jgi:tetratricopeptide (TPR) repeat protein
MLNCRWLVLGPALLLLLCGCTTTVQVHARFPANVAEAAPLRHVAVADFDGPEGDNFAYALEGMLASADFDGARYYTMMEMGHRGRGADTGYATQYGRDIHADGVFYGRMQTAHFDNFPYDEKTTRCVKKDADGKCVRHEDFFRPCLRRTFRMEVFPILVRVRDGHVVYSDRKSAGSETSWCRGDAQLTSDDSMIDGAIYNILASIRQDIAPYNTILNATVIEKTDGLPEADAKAFDAAVKAAGKGDLSSACHAWDAIHASQPNHAWTTYNIGVCAEANGDFAGALKLYEKARSTAPVVNSDITESIARAQNLIAAQQELRKTKKSRK